MFEIPGLPCRAPPPEHPPSVQASPALSHPLPFPEPFRLWPDPRNTANEARQCFFLCFGKKKLPNTVKHSETKNKAPKRRPSVSPQQPSASQLGCKILKAPFRLFSHGRTPFAMSLGGAGWRVRATEAFLLHFLLFLIISSPDFTKFSQVLDLVLSQH